MMLEDPAFLAVRSISHGNGSDDSSSDDRSND
jgi:hypothetical protein